MTQKPTLSGTLEAAAFVFALGIGAEYIFRAIPVFYGISVEAGAVIRVVLYCTANLALGFWLQRRYKLLLSRAALGFAVGVVAVFGLRQAANYVDGAPEYDSDVAFTVCLAFANWIVLTLGAVFSWRRSRKPAT